MLRAGDVQIGLGQDDWKKGRDREKGVGMRIYVSTTQDIDQLAADAKKRGSARYGGTRHTMGKPNV